MRFICTALILAISLTTASNALAANPKQDAQKCLALTFKAKEKLWTIPLNNSYGSDRKIVDHHLDILKSKFSYAAQPNHPLEAVENRMENIYRFNRHDITKVQHQLKQMMRRADKNNDKLTYDKAKFVYQIVQEIRIIVYDYKKND